MRPLNGKKTKFRPHSPYVHRHSDGLIRSRQRTATFSGRMINVDDNFAEDLDNWYADCLSKGICPDCFDDMPLEMSDEGQSCPTCGFFEPI